jgi:phage baseplate assembly protein W
LNPTYGGGLRSFIFEQISSNTLETLQEDVQSKINTFFPNVRVSNLEIFQEPDTNTITVSITYNVIDTAISDEIQIAFN